MKAKMIRAFSDDSAHKTAKLRYAGNGVVPAERRSFEGADNQMGENTQPRVIRDSAFAKRLALACDGHPDVPEFNKGRLVWVQQQLKSRFDTSVSMETVRKWFAGEARPRQEKMKDIAELLHVDLSWLSLGQESDMAPRERKARSALVDGAVNVIVGFIQMDGGHPAFPDEDDDRATENHIDIYAIIKGARYDIHVSSATETSQGVRFAVPSNYQSLVTIGVVRAAPFCVEVLELSHDLISEHGTRKSGHYEVELRRDSERSGYFSPSGQVPMLEGFARRL